MTEGQRYEIQQKLDAGGMAEVFKGVAKSLEGFEKQVAIKRVLPHLAANENFVDMFLDEARLSLYLNHANIVQVFDVGRAGETYFIVMEFIEGANMKKVMDAVFKTGQRFSPHLAAYVMVEVCKGLAYAHNKTGRDGEPLGIVHRDISPPNVLISVQGEVKLVDFGLAKAESQIVSTDPGVVKGKFGYLSPEAAWGESIDARTDIFAVGIVLWEMLAGERLFRGGTDLDTLQLVREAKIPSITNLNPEVPKELEAIISKALAKDPNERYLTARDLGRDLARFLVQSGVSVTAYDLADLVSTAISREKKPASERPIAAAVIEDEINRLTRVASPPATKSPAPSAFEDPRTWGGLFDEGEDLFGGGGEEDRSVLDGYSGGYASAPSSENAVTMPPPRAAKPAAPKPPLPKPKGTPPPKPPPTQEAKKDAVLEGQRLPSAPWEKVKTPPAKPSKPTPEAEPVDKSQLVFLGLLAAVVVVAAAVIYFVVTRL